jgi:hypothetical protein
VIAPVPSPNSMKASSTPGNAATIEPMVGM